MSRNGRHKESSRQEDDRRPLKEGRINTQSIRHYSHISSLSPPILALQTHNNTIITSTMANLFSHHFLSEHHGHLICGLTFFENFSNFLECVRTVIHSLL